MAHEMYVNIFGEPRAMGWRQDIEDRDWLRQRQWKMIRRAAFRAPEEFDPSKWLRVEDQGQQGSCSGHGLTSATEVGEWLKTKGHVVQLSRQWSYIQGQRVDGINGDQGATITGAVKGAMAAGVCREELAPYTGQYYTRFKPEAAKEARDHRIRNHVSLRSYDEVLNFLQAGQGAVVIGIQWTQGLANNNTGRVTLRNMGGQVEGGHCNAWVGWRKTGQIIDVNSWGRRWGRNGFADFDPEVVDRLCRDSSNEIIGVSDLSESFGKARGFDFMTDWALI